MVKPETTSRVIGALIIAAVLAGGTAIVQVKVLAKDVEDHEPRIREVEGAVIDLRSEVRHVRDGVTQNQVYLEKIADKLNVVVPPPAVHTPHGGGDGN